MANALTGDFDAVLEISASTVQRLLAILHRNAYDDAKTPSLPHLVNLRLDSGDDHGQVVAQVGVPILKLIDGSTDTFHLDVGVRARFVADEWSFDALPEYINGTIGADYRMDEVDATCSGWEQAAKDHVWLRVVAGSVTFRGTTRNDDDGDIALYPTDTPEVHERVRRLAEDLLTHRFAATPHRVSSGFRPGMLRQIGNGGGDTAIAIPVGLDGGVPSGSASSVGRNFLGGFDVALALSSDVIVAQVQQALDAFRQQFGLTVRVHFTAGVFGWDVVDIDITWAVGVDSTSATWVGPPGLSGQGADLDVRVHGSARTHKSQYDWSFDVTQRIHVTLDASNDWVSARTVGDPDIRLNYEGPWSDEAKSLAQAEVTNSLRAQIQSLAASMGASLGLAERAEQLARQLRTLDRAALVRWDRATYYDEGIVVVGIVFVSTVGTSSNPRFEKRAEGDGYTAMDFWMPGGRIDQFWWSWHWHDGSRPDGEATFKDRWILRRPHDGTFSQFGAPLLVGSPLPGLDGPGKVTLGISGVLVDDVTGDLVDFHASTDPIDLTIHPGTIPEKGVVIGGGLTGEALGGKIQGHTIEVLGGGRPAFVGANMLVARVGTDVTAAEVTTVLAAGLAGATTVGAGLQVVLLHQPGTRDAAGIEADARLLHEEVGALAPTYVSLDIEDSWSTALGLPTESSATVMALVSPTGGTSWMYQGDDLGGTDLAGALDGHLVPSKVPDYQGVRPYFGKGDLLDPWTLMTSGDRCPPPPIGRQGTRTILTFVRPGGESNGRVLALVKRLAPDPDDVFTAIVTTAAVVDGAPLREAGLVGQAVPIADPHGEIAARLGIRTWPTTVLLDEDGVIVKVIPGVGEDLAEPTDPTTEATA